MVRWTRTSSVPTQWAWSGALTCARPAC